MQITVSITIRAISKVRVDGLDYSIDPNVPKGKHITDMELKGKKRVANKKYKVAGWASMS